MNTNSMNQQNAVNSNDKNLVQKQGSDKNNMAFGKMNYILLGVSMVVVIIGFILMGGSASTEEAYNPDIFNATRTKVAPVVCFVGFIMMIGAIMFKKK